MLVLFYALLCIYFIDCLMAQEVVEIMKNLLELSMSEDKDSSFTWKEGMLLASFTVEVILTFMLTLFFKFHIRLLKSNSTTIENMEKQKAEDENSKVLPIYNMGIRNNLIQVFGKNVCL